MAPNQLTLVNLIRQLVSEAMLRVTYQVVAL